MNKKVTSILSYCTILGWLVAYLAGEKDAAKFHLNQGLTLGIVGAGSSIIFSSITGICSAIAATADPTLVKVLFGLFGGLFGLLGSLVGIAVTVLTVVGILNAVKEKEEILPVIGKFTLLK